MAKAKWLSNNNNINNERAYQLNQLLWLLLWVSPTGTQPKHVLKADGEPEGANCQPWSIVRLKMLAPRSRSMLPGVPINAPWGAKVWVSQKDIWQMLHLRLKGTRPVGRLVVTLGSTTASTARVFPQSFTILRSTIPREKSQVAEPPMPSTFMEWRLFRRCRRCAGLSVMNKVEDAESNRALAFIVELSALTILTWHILSTTGWRPPNCEWCVTVPDICFEGDTSLVCFQASLSMCSQVRWGIRYFLHFWPIRTLVDKMSWLQAVNAMPMLLKNCHHLHV